jgi:hypothetical protein
MIFMKNCLLLSLLFIFFGCSIHNTSSITKDRSILGVWQNAKDENLVLIFSENKFQEIYLTDTSIYEYEIKKEPCDNVFKSQRKHRYLSQKDIKTGQVLCSQIYYIDKNNFQLINPGNGIVDDFIRISDR